MTIFRRLSVALLLLPLMLATSLADAQSPIKPRVRSEADITPDTACGALATGRHAWTRIVTEYQEPHARVNAEGYWVGCGFPVPDDPPPPPKACTAPEVVRWRTGDVECSAAGGQRLDHAATKLYRPTPGPVDGILSLQCTDGTLAPLVAGVCSRVSWCEASSWRSTDDGGRTWITWSGRLAEGRIAYARREDGTRVRITCQDGRIRRAS